MKKVLILVASREKLKAHLDPLMAEYRARRSSISDCTADSLDQLSFFISNDSAIITDSRGNDLSEYDLIVFRTVGKNKQEAVAVTEYCKKFQIPFSDPAIDTLCAVDDENKLAQMMCLFRNGVSVPPTFYGPREAILAQKYIPYPCVLKAIDGHRGQNNFLISNARELSKLLKKDTKYILQSFIPNSEDYRVLVANQNQFAVTLRRRKNNQTHLNNVSMGADEIFIDSSDCPSDLLKIAKSAAASLKLGLAGVDIVVDENTKIPYIIEVNRAPQLTLPSEKNAFFDLIDHYDEGSPKRIIGTNTLIEVAEIKDVPAKIDTGADSSAIWASDIDMSKDGVLSFKLFGKESPFYDGKTIKTKDYKVVITRSSHGDEKVFYRTHLPIKIKTRKIRALFTLADRSKNNFPILIGRRTLNNKFLVDASLREIITEKNPATHHLNRRLKQDPYTFHQEYIKNNQGKL